MNARSAEARRHHPVRRPRPSVPGRAKATPTRLRRCSGCVVFVRIGSILARTDGAGHSRAIRQGAQRTQRVDPRAAFTRVEHAERVRRSRRVGVGVGGFRPFVELDCCEHVPVSVAGGPDAGNAQRGDSATSSHRGNACRARAGLGNGGKRGQGAWRRKVATKSRSRPRRSSSGSTSCGPFAPLVNSTRPLPRSGLKYASVNTPSSMPVCMSTRASP